MTPPRDIWPADEAPDGWIIRRVAETGSTNEDLLRQAERGEAGNRTVLVADHQTAGRGRLDRRWDAPPGANLLASMYLAVVPAPASELMQRVGLAVLRAVDGLIEQAGSATSPRRAGLKWPNDVLLDGVKLAGVLAQRSSGAPGAVIGFGVNVGWAPEGAARLGVVADITPAELLAAVLRAFDALPADIGDAYADRLVTIGQIVRVELPRGGVQLGRAVGVDDYGRLLVVDADQREHCFAVGDVVHVRPADVCAD